MDISKDKIYTSLGLSKGLFHNLEPKITKSDILADLKAELAFLEFEESAELFKKIKELENMDDTSFWELYEKIPPLEIIGESIVPISETKEI